MLKHLLKICLYLFIVSMAFLLLNNKWYLKNKKWQLTEHQQLQLQQLGDSALLSADIPVASLLLYKDSIIGTGYNNVIKENNPAGHAEMNAITTAMQKTGYSAFMKMNRDSLVLITTWDPCEMCEGAIIQYHINHVVIIQPKSFKHWVKEWDKQLKYEWNKQTTNNDTLQDHLFKLHPDYEKQKKSL